MNNPTDDDIRGALEQGQCLEILPSEDIVFLVTTDQVSVVIQYFLPQEATTALLQSLLDDRLRIPVDVPELVNLDQGQTGLLKRALAIRERLRSAPTREIGE